MIIHAWDLVAGDPHKTPIDDGFFDAAVSGALTVKDLSETVGHLVNPKYLDVGSLSQSIVNAKIDPNEKYWKIINQ